MSDAEQSAIYAMAIMDKDKRIKSLEETIRCFMASEKADMEKINSLEAQLEEEKKEFHLTMIDCEREMDELQEKWRNAEDANIKLSEKIVEYRKLLEKDSELQAKMADGWCLVSPEDFERLQEAKRVGD